MIINTNPNVRGAPAKLKRAITQLSQDRAGIGADRSRWNATARHFTISREYLTAANSSIREVDIAEESTEYARQNSLVQSGTAELAPANAMSQSALRLLQ
jgi:flagellin